MNLEPQQHQEQTLAECREKFTAWLKESIKTLDSKLGGVVRMVQINTEAIKTDKTERLALIGSLAALTDTVSALSTKLDSVVKANTELGTAYAELKAVHEEEHSQCSHTQLVDYVENLVRDLTGNSEDPKNRAQGANIIGFDPTKTYDKGTVGHALKVITKNLQHEPVFFNLGQPTDVLAEDTVNVQQTYVTLFNPKNALPGSVSTIEGGDANDMILVAFRGSVTIAATGNIRLRAPFEATETSVLALRKVDSHWKEVWRSK